MKRLLVLALCFIFVFASVSFAEVWRGSGENSGWTAESHINPFEFDKWEPIKVERCRSGGQHMHAIMQNYDVAHPVKIVYLVMTPVGPVEVVIYGFAYSFEGYIWSWYKNDTEKKYDLVNKMPLPNAPAAPQNPRIIPNKPEVKPKVNSDGMS
jgi:hypothetical protein